MCIIRVAKNSQNQFTRVDRRYLESPVLSLKAKGLLTYLLSKPNHWQIKLRELQQSNADGKDAIRSTIKELERQGYMVRKVTRDARGRFHTDYTIYEVSQLKVERVKKAKKAKKAEKIEKVEKEREDESTSRQSKQEKSQDQQERAEVVSNVKTAQTGPCVAQTASSNTKVAEQEISGSKWPEKVASLPNEQRVSIAKLLSRVKTEDRSSVLSVLSGAMERQELRNPVGYLAGIIRKYLVGEFSLPRESRESRESKQKKLEIKKCPLCDKRGLLEGYVSTDTGNGRAMFSIRCKHDLEEFQRVVSNPKNRVIEVFSASDEYRYPNRKPKNSPGSVVKPLSQQVKKLT